MLPVLEAPTYEIELPSNKEKILFRPFLVKEHKLLMTLSDTDTKEVSRVIKQLVDVCTFNKLNVDTLPSFDIEYIFLKLRSKSISESVDLVVNCECGEKIDHTINLEDLKIENDNKIDPNVNIRDDIGVKMRYPNFEETIDIADTKQYDKIFDTVSDCIEAVYDKNNYQKKDNFTSKEIKEFILNMTKEEFSKIEEFFINLPKVVQHISATCKKCNLTNNVRLEGIENFFV
jgi:hypothetical protein